MNLGGSRRTFVHFTPPPMPTFLETVDSKDSGAFDALVDRMREEGGEPRIGRPPFRENIKERLLAELAQGISYECRLNFNELVQSYKREKK